MQETRTWRELLKIIIADNVQKKRLIEVLKVTPITLTRWANGESEPRPRNLRQLAMALPQYRENFLHLIYGGKGEAEDIMSASVDAQSTIPSTFYTQVLAARATTNENLRFWAISHLILRHALGQLDLDHQGMAIWIISCMPPSGPHHKVRSLRESVGVGTTPWAGHLEQEALFLGAESIIGGVITQYRPNVINDIDKEQKCVLSQYSKFGESAAAFPILQTGKIAGAFLAVSTVPDYFQFQSRTELVQSYAELVALAFDPTEFYTIDQIALSVMPGRAEQEQHFSHFRSLLRKIIVDASIHEKTISNQEVELLAWKQLEEELLSLSSGGAYDNDL